MSVYKKLKKRYRIWSKDIEKKIDWKYRQATSYRRKIPDFLIIGAMKSGTTSLNKYLSQHPNLVPPYKKEVHYFDGGGQPIDNYERGLAWYRSHFELEKKLCARQQRTYEASPLYIFNPLAPKRIHELIPGVKLIALLRNPSDRAVSHYFHEKRRGREELPILEAFISEEDRIKKLAEKKDYRNRSYIHFSYKRRGIYHEQIKRYFKYFSSSNILIIQSENFFNYPNENLKKIFNFIGVDQDYSIKNLKPRNVGKNKADVDTSVYEYLDNYFKPHNKELFKLLGQNFDW